MANTPGPYDAKGPCPYHPLTGDSEVGEYKGNQMSAARFENIEACVFDAYGTLLDFNSAASSPKDALGKDAEALSSIWRQKQIEYTWLRSGGG